MGFKSSVRNAGGGLNELLVIGFLGIVWLMIYGNLSGNLGFTTGSQGDNDTKDVINNMTRATKTFYTYSNTIFTIMAIVLLITILLSLLYIVMKIGGGKSKGDGFASGE